MVDFSMCSEVLFYWRIWPKPRKETSVR